jgi:hypothetical protein
MELDILEMSLIISTKINISMQLLSSSKNLGRKKEQVIGITPISLHFVNENM